MISFYDDQVNFEANSSTSVVVTFDPFTPLNENIYIPPETPITINDITFTPVDSLPLDTPNLVVANPGGTVSNDFAVPLTSNVLTTSGNENIDITFSTAPTAVGFDTYTNMFYPPKIVSVYDTDGNLRAKYVLSQARESFGFLGIVSDFPIKKVNWLATKGGAPEDLATQDTGIANVRVGDAK